MKRKRIILTVYLTVFACITYAQRTDVQQIFVATSEDEMYKLYNQMLDSARLSSWYLNPGNIERFDFTIFEEVESKDTLMKFVQRCRKGFRGDYICERSYRTYLSNSMTIGFYERFLRYLRQLDKTENYYIKSDINNPLNPVLRIIIKQYESGTLDKEDNIKVQQLIEETILRLINDDHNYRSLISYHKYIMDTIRQALVNVIENPFYPTEYLDFYMSLQDTSCVDTIGIPGYIKKKNRRESFTDEERVYLERLRAFSTYERIGREEYNGLSAGQAYLRRKRETFRETGYLPINYIEEYAYQKQDKLLIEHLKEFKKKHPDYPLKYF